MRPFEGDAGGKDIPVPLPDGIRLPSTSFSMEKCNRKIQMKSGFTMKMNCTHSATAAKALVTLASVFISILIQIAR